jgi:septal ring factor EnvC (AmiA/AmiB activator)
MFHEIVKRLDVIEATLKALQQLIGVKIMATQAELAVQINTLTAQVQKIATESSKTLQMVTDLQSLIAAGGTVTPELQASVDALAAQIKVTDDLVPDAPAPTP